ncbi:hypothetical protein STEG23_033361, partial [Scotinomys teguina]
MLKNMTVEHGEHSGGRSKCMDHMQLILNDLCPPWNVPHVVQGYLRFQKVTNNKKQFQRLPASKNNIQKVFKTETQGINAMKVTDILKSTSFLLKKATVKEG